MGWLYQLRVRLGQAGLLPASKLALITWYFLGFDVFLFLLQKILAFFIFSLGESLGGWVTGLSLAVIVLFAILAMRWTKAKLLWRLRNRLIVTYVFIGVIPVILLGASASGILLFIRRAVRHLHRYHAYGPGTRKSRAANSAISQILRQSCTR